MLRKKCLLSEVRPPFMLQSLLAQLLVEGQAFGGQRSTRLKDTSSEPQGIQQVVGSCLEQDG